jgi:hypothetical protein
MFMSNATQAARIAKQISYDPSCNCTRPTYIAIFVTGSIVPVSSTSSSQQTKYFLLEVPTSGGFTAGGGDESKKQWFIRIGNSTAHTLYESQFLECPSNSPGATASSGQPCTNVDDFNLTPHALSDTLFGQLLPFRLGGYLVTTQSSSSSTPQISLAGSYQFGTNGAPPLEAFSFPASFTYGTNSTSLFKLVYASPSLTLAQNGSSNCPGSASTQFQCFNEILVYEVL